MVELIEKYNRKWGFENEKLANSKALADFASTCFTGAALRWYETLDESTKRDWDVLRKAILLQYPHTKSVENSFIDQRFVESRLILPLSLKYPSSPFVPTPAAAPPLFVNASYTGKPADILAGRLRFIAELPSSSGYISRTASNGLFEVTTDRSNALHVQIDTSRTMQPLQITVRFSLASSLFISVQLLKSRIRTRILKCPTLELPVRLACNATFRKLTSNLSRVRRSPRMDGHLGQVSVS